MVAIAVAFHGKPPSICTFHDHINPVSDRADLSSHAVSAL
jgi:hypothetical protein